MHDITFVTYDKLPAGDPDDLLALGVLTQRGHKTQVAVWNDPSVDWSKAGLCILRSTWDYFLRYDAFASWLSNVSSVTTLLNPIDLVNWNINKYVYLQDLTQGGAPVVDTVFVPRNTQIDLKQILDERGWRRAVIKPGIGAGTHGVQQVTNEPCSIADGQKHLQSVLASGDALIQPYLSAVETYGERALVFIDGTYSHAISKTPFQALLPTGQAGEQSVHQSTQELEAATRVIGLLPTKPLYARVDLIPDNSGQVRLLELELVEPSLFFSLADSSAATRFADAIDQRLSAAYGMPLISGTAGF